MTSHARAPHTALVTGGTGFIASRLVPELLRHGWAVRACGRRARPAELPPEVDYRSVDLVTDRLDGIADGCARVFHLAGASSSLSDDDEMWRANVVGTRRLLAALPGGVERFVHMSSTSVYGESVQLELPVHEDVVPQPSRSYGKAKWGAEQAVAEAAEAGLATVVLRPVSVFGPGAVKLLASVMLDAAVEKFAGLDRLEVGASVIEQRLVHVDDLVDACLYLAGHDAAVGSTFNVASIYPSSHEVAGVVAGAMGLDLVVTSPTQTEPGLDWDRRQRVHAEMTEAGMAPNILLTPQRFRLLAKANRNNRLSGEALASVGFRFRNDDLAASVTSDLAWYRQKHWLL